MRNIYIVVTDTPENKTITSFACLTEAGAQNIARMCNADPVNVRMGLRARVESALLMVKERDDLRALDEADAALPSEPT
jgi:hypothetical protein